MTKSSLVATGLLFCLLSAPVARAQTTIDVSKITCEQFQLYKITNPNNIALWISGYYHGKSGNTVLDVQEMRSHVEKVRNYCTMNEKVTVMQAVETVLGGKK